MDKFQKIFFSPLTIILAVAAIVVPILWETYINVPTVSVERISSSFVVTKPVDNPKIQLTFDGRLVENVFKDIFQLRVSGINAIRGSDIVDPIKIVYKLPAMILDTRIESTEPRDINVSTSRDVQPNIVTIHSDLLNNNDSLVISVLGSGDPNGVEIKGRIAGIQSLVFSNNSQSHDAAPNFFKTPATWLGFAGFISILIVAISSISQFINETKAKRMLSYVIRNSDNPMAIEILRTAVLQHMRHKNKRKLFAIKRALDNYRRNTQDTSELLDIAELALLQTSSTAVQFLVMLIWLVLLTSVSLYLYESIF